MNPCLNTMERAGAFFSTDAIGIPQNRIQALPFVWNKLSTTSIGKLSEVTNSRASTGSLCDSEVPSQSHLIITFHL